MLVPQHTPSCRHCGYLPAFPTTRCPSCGAVRLASWPPQVAPIQPLFVPPPSFPTYPQANGSALLIEILLNCLGLYGVGWLLSGNTTVGVLLLIGSLVLWPLMGLLIILTLGFALFFVAPLALGLIVCNAVLLSKATRSIPW
jgi:hypothetical protein